MRNRLLALAILCSSAFGQNISNPPSGGGGTSTLAGATDISTANLPGLNTPLNTALAGKVATSTLAALATGPLKNTTSTGVLSIATSADILGLWSGTKTSSTVMLGDGTMGLVTAFPNSNLRGTFLGVGMGNSASAGATVYPFSDTFALSSACVAPTTQYWLQPIGGYLRNMTVTTSGANSNDLLRSAPVPNCAAYAGGVVQAGALVPPASAAGGYIDSFAGDFYHVGQYQGLGLAFNRSAAGVPAIVASLGLEFISDDGSSDSIFGFVQNLALSSSATQYIGFDSFGGSTEGLLTIPLPIAGTLKNLMASTSVGPTSAATLTVNKNGANTAVTLTIGAGDTAGSYTDITHTASVAAGDFIDLQTVTGAGTAPTMQAATLLFVPTDGISAIIHGSTNSGAAGTTARYAQPFGTQTSTTEASMEYTSPIACSISHLYAYQSTANGAGVTTTLTIMKNGVASAVTGTISPATTGSQAIDTTHNVAIVAGDRISLQYISNTGTGGAMGGWSAQCN